MTHPVVDTLGVTPQEWFVAFEPKTSIWWGRFLAPGFGHCYAFGYVPLDEHSGVWLFQEALVRGVFVGVASPDMVLGWWTLAKMGKLRILKIRPQQELVVRPRWAVTCAGAVGALLGLKRLPITPHGLFWMLRRLGAVEVGRLEDGRSTESRGAAGTDTGGAGAAEAGGGGSEGGRGPGAGGEAEGGAEPDERGCSGGGWPARTAVVAVGGG